MSNFKNIDGESSVTSWYSPAHNELFKDLGYGNFTDQTYTIIDMEIPIAINIPSYNPYTFAQYWGMPPVMKTKLGSISSTFKIEYTPYENSLEVYINNVEVMYEFPVPDQRYFKVLMDPFDGFLWAKYTPNAVDNVIGDTRSLLLGNGRIPRYVVPNITIDNIIRSRLAVNNIEAYLESRPSSWIGGVNNTIKAKANSLIPGVTPVHSSQLVELQSAISRAEYNIDGKVDHLIPRYSFSPISITDNYMVGYIEEILEAINLVEDMIITYL